MPGDLPSLLDLAAEVADGATVDWVRDEAKLLESSGVVKQLRVLADVAELHRSHDEDVELLDSMSISYRPLRGRYDEGPSKGPSI